MPPIKNSAIKKLISMHFKDTFDLKDDFDESNLLFCRVCKCNLVCRQKRHLIQHIELLKHKRCLDNDAFKPISSQSEFNESLGQFLVDMNIPMEKVNDVKFKDFFAKITQFEVPEVTTLRKKVLPNLFDNTIEFIRN